MKNRPFLVSRRIALLFGVLLVMGLAAGCGSDTESDNGGEGGNNTSGGDGGITLTYDGETVHANTSASATGAIFVGQLKKFNVTIVGGWDNADRDPAFGVITTKILLIGDSETEVSTGTYTLEEDTDGMGFLSGPMTAAFTVSGTPLGLPDKLIATSGTFKLDSIELVDSDLKRVAIDFDGMFKSADESDSAEYKLTGSIDLPVE